MAPAGIRAQPRVANTPRDDRAVEPLVCAGRNTPCRVIELRDAGWDDSGARLSAVRLALFESTASAHSVGTLRAGECDPYEWVALIEPVDAAPRVERLSAICNDGYGARGIGEDVVTVGANRFEHRRFGGSNWGWSEDVAVSLSPRRVLRRGSTGHWSVSSNFVADTSDYEHFSATGEWWAPLCSSEEHEITESDEGHENDGYRWRAIPRVAVLGDTRARIARGELDVTACSAPVDMALDGVGPPASREVAPVAYALWMANAELVVDVARGAVSDVLEVYASPNARPSYTEHCVAQADTARGFRVPVARGTVTRIGAGGAIPTVRRVRRADGGLRLLLALPHVARVTIVSVARRNGHARRVATSRLDVRDERSIGDVFEMAGAQCEIDGTRLVPRVVVPLARDALVIEQ